ncbi:MAG TPA: flavodoxin domain-containing protein [Gaiellaceae bacterium]|nr:flavodoxin domain-containing protein [Gaiellaceae bacterium]
MKTLLVVYASKHGSTASVAAAIGQRLRAAGLHVDVCEAKDARDVAGYDGVVVGGSLYAGKWNRDAIRFLRRSAHALRGLPVAVFALGPRTLEPADIASSRAQLDAALAGLDGVEPALVTVFGGAIDPSKLRFPFNRMPASDARDWDAVDEWARRVAETVAYAYT